MRDHDEMPTVCSEVMRDGTVVVARGRSRSGAVGVAPAVASCNARGEEEASGKTRDSGREEHEEEEEEEESWAAPAEVLAEAAKLVLGAEPVATGAAPAAEGGAPAVAGVVVDVDVVVWMMTVLERTVLTSSYSSTTTGRCDFDDTGTAEAIVVVDAISKAAAGCLAKFVVVERE